MTYPQYLMKVLVFGMNGMLGRYIHDHLISFCDLTVIGLTRSMYDPMVDGMLQLENVFVTHMCDSHTVVFNAIGAIPHAMTDKDIASTYYAVNSVFPMMLSAVCKKFGCKLIHPSTDCVFSGRHGAYSEQDTHDETGHYGVSKSIGERIKGTIIRASIIGENSKGISLLEWVKSNANGRAVGYTNHMWNGITCLQYAKLVKYIIDNQLFWEGVRHVRSPNVVSKFDLIRLINAQYGCNIRVQPTLSDTFCDRSLVSIYEMPFEIPEIEEQIKELHDYHVSRCCKSV